MIPGISIEQAVEALKHGQLVVLPTETVYGLAGDFRLESAIQQIYTVKQRPPNHPLVIHVLDANMAKEVVEWTDAADLLATRFWPGPLGFILKKQKNSPSWASGGLETLAVRAPNHPAFLEVLSNLESPLAAPSANFFTELSPTRAENISEELLQHTAGFVDGGPCQVGIESTLIDLTDPLAPTLVRPGGLPAQKIEEVLGMTVVRKEVTTGSAPGSHRRHYQPKAAVFVVDQLSPDQPGLTFKPQSTLQIGMEENPAAYARDLYAALAELDRRGHMKVWIERTPVAPEWEAIHDRLARASAE